MRVFIWQQNTGIFPHFPFLHAFRRKASTKHRTRKKNENIFINNWNWEIASLCEIHYVHHVDVDKWPCYSHTHTHTRCSCIATNGCLYFLKLPHGRRAKANAAQAIYVGVGVCVCFWHRRITSFGWMVAKRQHSINIQILHRIFRLFGLQSIQANLEYFSTDGTHTHAQRSRAIVIKKTLWIYIRYFV